MACKTRRAGIAVLVSLLLFLLPYGPADDAAPDFSGAKQVSLTDYEQELSRIDQQLKSLVERPETAEDLRESIAEKLDVQSATGTFHIDNQDIRSQLERYSNRPADRGNILPELEYKVEAELEGAQDFARPADSTARGKLDAILQGREYRKLSHEPSPMEILKDRLLGWLIRLVERFFRAAAAHPRISVLLMWTIIGGVILGFLVWLYVLLRRTARDDYAFPRDGLGFVPSAKPWQQWLRDAHAAAERGDWRDAVHLAYWCSISYLESSGVWKPDRARTPREYLRTYKAQTGAGGRRESLEALTRRFESVWYAQQAAAAEDFQFSLAQLEKIGCR
jgi:hypothetical protein